MMPAYQPYSHVHMVNLIQREGKHRGKHVAKLLLMTEILLLSIYRSIQSSNHRHSDCLHYSNCLSHLLLLLNPPLLPLTKPITKHQKPRPHN